VAVTAEDLAKYNSLYDTDCNFEFSGWKFKFTPPQGRDSGVLILYKQLENPHPPDLFLSYRTYRTEGAEPFVGKQYAAAWLIAHWYEHKLKICACMNGEEPDLDGSSIGFRHALIKYLLLYEGVVGNANPIHETVP
jgi:hypothetical protein